MSEHVLDIVNQYNQTYHTHTSCYYCVTISSTILPYNDFEAKYTIAEQSSSTLFIAGLDEHGEKVHSAMYYDLWSNGPFEIKEFPDYTLIDHFKKPIPSFPPREAILDYLIGKSKYQ